jgi:hypothetical protein
LRRFRGNADMRIPHSAWTALGNADDGANVIHPA